MLAQKESGEIFMLKKLLSAILVGIMVLGMGATVFAAEPSSIDESKFIHNIDGVEFDIRKSKTPDNYESDRSIKSTEAATTDFSSVLKKDISPRISMPTGGGEYPYIPSYWNDTANIRRTNCYGYMLNRIAHDKNDPLAGYIFQPGFVNGTKPALNTADIINAVESDMSAWDRTIRSSSYSEKPGSNEYKVALVIAPDDDYHWYRQDLDGGWSHKPGLTEITYKDASGVAISDPQTCDRNYSYANYSTWCGYYIVTK